jgi:AbrB family looped-hinge helix DNA binding protein
MPSKLDEILKMKVYPKGQIVIPVSLRKKYNIDIGDHIQVIPSRDGIILKPSSETKNSKILTDRLFGIFRKYAHGKQKATKKDMIKATENGFIKGWKE